jgi:hypothetical protein
MIGGTSFAVKLEDYDNYLEYGMKRNEYSKQMGQRLDNEMADRI